MTRNEKGLNRYDLQAYKVHDNVSYSMLPGWSPQMGQLPHRENREFQKNRVQQKYNIKNDPSLPNLPTSNKIYGDLNSESLTNNNGNNNVSKSINNIGSVPNNSNKPYSLGGDTQPYGLVGNLDYGGAPIQNQLGSPTNNNIFGNNNNQNNNGNPYNNRGTGRERGFLSKAAENSLNNFNYQSSNAIPTSTRNNNKYGTGIGNNIFGINYNKSTLIPN